MWTRRCDVNTYVMVNYRWLPRKWFCLFSQSWRQALYVLWHTGATESYIQGQLLGQTNNLKPATAPSVSIWLPLHLSTSVQYLSAGRPNAHISIIYVDHDASTVCFLVCGRVHSSWPQHTHPRHTLLHPHSLPLQCVSVNDHKSRSVPRQAYLSLCEKRKISSHSCHSAM